MRQLPRKRGSLESNIDKFSVVLIKIAKSILCNYLFTCLTILYSANNLTLINWLFNLKNDLDSYILGHVSISVLLTLLLKSAGNKVL